MQFSVIFGYPLFHRSSIIETININSGEIKMMIWTPLAIFPTPIFSSIDTNSPAIGSLLTCVLTLVFNVPVLTWFHKYDNVLQALSSSAEFPCGARKSVIPAMKTSHHLRSRNILSRNSNAFFMCHCILIQCSQYIIL